MIELSGYCGLDCQTCPIYLAARQDDKQEQARMRLEILRQCKEQYGMNYVLEDITDCDGCNSDGGKLFSACKTCPIRICAREKKLESCAYCLEYACGKLEAFIKIDPGAKSRLDAIRIHPAN